MPNNFLHLTIDRNSGRERICPDRKIEQTQWNKVPLQPKVQIFHTQQYARTAGSHTKGAHTAGGHTAGSHTAGSHNAGTHTPEAHTAGAYATKSHTTEAHTP